MEKVTLQSYCATLQKAKNTKSLVLGSPSSDWVFYNNWLLLVNVTTCCKCLFILTFTTSDNISEDDVFLMSPLGVNITSYWLLQLVMIFKKMSSLVVRFIVSKVAKFHKNSQNNFQMSPHFVKSALNRECKHFTSSCHTWKSMTFSKYHHLL